MIEEARAQTRGIVDLPDGEGVVLETVEDILAIHETYPGHQAERAVKEQLLVRVRDLLD